MSESAAEMRMRASAIRELAAMADSRADYRREMERARRLERDANLLEAELARQKKGDSGSQ